MQTRVASIDIIRGAVMVLMAVDHVRVYSGVPAGGPSLGVFFTRWVTHFCAPAFVFLAGTSAFLLAQKLNGKISRFLFIRGAWLIVLELTLIRFFWTFNFEVSHLLAGVIWVIGWSVIVLALLVRLPLVAIAAFGLVIIAAHNVADLIPGLQDRDWSPLWKIVYFGGPIGGEDAFLFVLYSLIPWIGVMAAGYAFGAILLLESARRRRICLAIGLGATLLFLVLRAINRYGNPTPWNADWLPAWLSFLNPTKYPASLDFLLMTLGPTIAVIPLLERARGPIARVMEVFGRVPLFYYLLHIPLIHIAAIVVSLVRSGTVTPWLFADHPAMVPPAPEGYRWRLWLLYIVWAISVALLYPLCRWFADVKARRSQAWLRYL